MYNSLVNCELDVTLIGMKKITNADKFTAIGVAFCALLFVLTFYGGLEYIRYLTECV